MKQILLVILLLCPIFAKKESLDDLSDLLNDPELLFELRKRFGNLLDDTIEDDDFTEPVVGCYALHGTLNGDCYFHTNGSTIIKTTESIEKGATFIANVANITCARDCTAQCCLNDKCDTSVYQDKKEHSCYLFQCGQPSKCVFVHHSDYWMGSISKEVHKSHQYTPGGATPSHENELANLGAQGQQDSVDIPTTTMEPIVKTTKKPKATTARIAVPVAKPELDEFCPSYETVCADPHAVCLMQTCRCHVGYHKKHNVCRKHCRDEEFQCEDIGYGPSVTDCVRRSEVCNNKQDCDDGSDERDCPPDQDDKTAYQDSDPTSNLYNNPLYNLPYGNQPDTQYPYGFPISGLTNQQQTGILPTNQIYPNQIQPNGQYYYPSLTNQNAVPQAGNQLGAQQWPFIDKNVGRGSQIFPNTNQVYQPVQQPGYLSPQTGNYVPVVQNPVIQSPVQKLPVQVRPNIQQPIQILPNQNMIQPVVQPVNPAVVNQVTQAPVANNVQPVNTGTQIAQERGQDHNEMNKQVPSNDAFTDPPPTLSKTMYNSGTKFVKAEDTVESRNEYYDDTTVGHRLPSLSMFDRVDVGKGNSDEDIGKDSENNGKAAGRHSAEIDEDQFYQKPKTYPPATKAKTQIGSPTQSTAAGQRHSHSNSEGFPDYSWVSYDSKGPKVSGKKGSSVINNKHASHEDTGTKQRTKIQDNDGKTGTRKPAANDHVTKQGNDNSPIPATKYDDRTSESNYDYDLDRYPGRLTDDYPRPTNNHRPSYDRYRDRFADNRRRPGHGSRYPYYDTGYARGRDRNQYPVWDKFRDEYYYPEDSFNGDRADVKHDLTYEDISAARPNEPGSFNKDEHRAMKPTVKPVVTEAPVKIASTSGDNKDVPAVTTSKPTVTDAPVVVAFKPILIDDPKAQSESSESVDTEEDASESNGESEDIDSNSAEDSESNNDTDSSQDMSNADKPFRLLNADAVEVDTYTDNSQGPIVALALGLSITMMLLIFVGCRLRTVKRRLRKGRALHSNEADYLINGMYL